MAHLQNIQKVFFALALLLGFTACNNHKPSDKRDIQLLVDSTAYHNNASSDSARKRNTSGDKSIQNNNTSSNSSTNNPGTVPNSPTSNATQSKNKKGWSKAAQGAVIGGATGAVGGAIISKKKGTGAAIGAAVGAAGGYIIGHEKDKKDGRAKK